MPNGVGERTGQSEPPLDVSVYLPHPLSHANWHGILGLKLSPQMVLKYRGQISLDHETPSLDEVKLKTASFWALHINSYWFFVFAINLHDISEWKYSLF
jgi:hypothetical protein